MQHFFKLIVGFIVGNKLEVEFVEILALIGYLIFTWRKETRVTKIGFPAIIIALSIDVFYFQCRRPLWVCALFNIPSVFGWLWLYEKLKNIVRRFIQTSLVLVVNLFR